VRLNKSNDLVAAVIYPDSTGSTDEVQYTYDRQGEMLTMEDQNQTTHTYTVETTRGPFSLEDSSVHYTEPELSQTRIDNVSPFDQAASYAVGQSIQAVETPDGNGHTMQGNNRVYRAAEQQGLPSVEGNVFSPDE
jgi:hypothetical protein